MEDTPLTLRAFQLWSEEFKDHLDTKDRHLKDQLRDVSRKVDQTIALGKVTNGRVLKAEAAIGDLERGHRVIAGRVGVLETAKPAPEGSSDAQPNAQPAAPTSRKKAQAIAAGVAGGALVLWEVGQAIVRAFQQQH